METLAVSWGTRAITAEVLRRPRRRTVAISVVPRTGVEVLAPPGVPIAHLEQILLKKGEWVCRRLDALADLLGDDRPREFVSGE